MRRFVIIFVLVGVLVGPQSGVLAQGRRGGSSSAAAAASARQGAEQITAEQMRDYLTFIAADEMEGRDTPSRGLDLTAKFLAVQLSRWGFRPAGDGGTFFQKIALRRERVDMGQSRVEIDGQVFKPGTDFIAFAPGGTVSLNGPVVFGGNGWLIKSRNMDAYRGLDVKDKIVVIASPDGLPKGVSQRDLTGTRGVDWDDPAAYAQKRGARALLAIPDSQIINNWERVRQRVMGRTLATPEKFRGPEMQLARIIISPRMADALFQGEARTSAAISEGVATGSSVAPFELSATKRVNLNIAAERQTINTQNVVAVLEGSDPVLKNEYVAVGAHYDHVGTGTPVNGDSIYNGADDDGSGTTAILAMAEALAKTSSRPKRSILLIWHCGEEKGLWGSRYFVENPTVPLAQIVTQLNIDMIGRSRRAGDTNPANRDLSGPDEIYVIGSKMMSTELGQLSERVNRNYLNLTFNYKYDDPNDPERFFFRSDHYNYAQKGIPIIFYFDGVHEDYHRPGDEVSKIDFRKMVRVTRTIYATLREIANAPARPRVDKQLPGELRN
ncbi:MAG: M20/M25/M40 family metallo-hydrolase [Pyrinomonadaceae bacterium]|nr:M20/M25/M40 family metallo-hydrolase [Pyrinomonadaceae bacterium]